MKILLVAILIVMMSGCVVMTKKRYNQDLAFSEFKGYWQCAFDEGTHTIMDSIASGKK